MDSLYYVSFTYLVANESTAGRLQSYDGWVGKSEQICKNDLGCLLLDAEDPRYQRHLIPSPKTEEDREEIGHGLFHEFGEISQNASVGEDARVLQLIRHHEEDENDGEVQAIGHYASHRNALDLQVQYYDEIVAPQRVQYWGQEVAEEGNVGLLEAVEVLAKNVAESPHEEAGNVGY